MITSGQAKAFVYPQFARSKPRAVEAILEARRQVSLSRVT